MPVEVGLPWRSYFHYYAMAVRADARAIFVVEGPAATLREAIRRAAQQEAEQRRP